MSVQKTGTAYFVRQPRRADELIVLHAVDWEIPYEIVQEIILKGIDYENFITDMTVDRQFIENYASLCDNTSDHDGQIKKCLFVHGRDPRSGILVIPEAKCYVGWAAFINEGKDERAAI